MDYNYPKKREASGYIGDNLYRKKTKEILESANDEITLNNMGGRFATRNKSGHVGQLFQSKDTTNGNGRISKLR